MQERNVTEIYCLGDIIHKGVHSSECIKLVRENCDVVVQGNCDDYFTKEHDLDSIDSEIERERIRWSKSLLTDDDREYLQSLPLTYEFYISGRLVRIFHATPKNAYDVIGVCATFEEKANAFLPTEYTSDKTADVAVYGHIHVQLLSKEYNRTLINCGSVGNALDYVRNEDKDADVRNTTNADYLIIEGRLNSKDYSDPLSFQLVRVPYDIEKELNNDEYNPEKEAYTYELTKGRYRDMSKIHRYFEKSGVDMTKL